MSEPTRETLSEARRRIIEALPGALVLGSKDAIPSTIGNALDAYAALCVAEREREIAEGVETMPGRYQATGALVCPIVNRSDVLTLVTRKAGK